MTRSPWGASRNIWRESNAPFSLSLILASALVFLLGAFGVSLADYLSYSAPVGLLQPWRLLTYPVALGRFDIIGLLFYGLMLWWVGASLERSWGTKFYAAFFTAMSLITALGMTLGAFTFHVPVPVGYFLPMSALFFAWCCLNPGQEIRIYGIIPVLAKWMAVAEVLIIFFTHAQFHPLMGVFALMGCGAAFWWVKKRAWANVDLYQTTPRRWDDDSAPSQSRWAVRKPKLNLVPPRAPKPRDDRFTLRDLNPLEWFAKRKRRKQFEKLMRDD